ncbi:hypothetical protein ACQ4M4_18080 [Leptolyngbya sp. AN02str]|uniref:hypothetical protein n=1 Tax=Leptolyngbya sp. AN02str TaxID=3423363 RepID=UPI003D3228D0
MAGERAKHYVRIGGAVGDIGESKFGFLAPDKAYDNIADELGVNKISDNNSARGILFGANFPKPPRVRLSGIEVNFGGGTGNDRRRSCIRYCDPDKIGRVLNGSLNDATAKTSGYDFKVDQASMGS